MFTNPRRSYVRIARSFHASALTSTRSHVCDCEAASERSPLRAMSSSSTRSIVRIMSCEPTPRQRAHSSTKRSSTKSRGPPPNLPALVVFVQNTGMSITLYCMCPTRQLVLVLEPPLFASEFPYKSDRYV